MSDGAPCYFTHLYPLIYIPSDHSNQLDFRPLRLRRIPFRTNNQPTLIANRRLPVCIYLEFLYVLLPPPVSEGITVYFMEFFAQSLALDSCLIGLPAGVRSRESGRGQTCLRRPGRIVGIGSLNKRSSSGQVATTTKSLSTPSTATATHFCPRCMVRIVLFFAILTSRPVSKPPFAVM